MVLDNHEYYQTKERSDHGGAQRSRGSEVRAITGSEVRAITGATVSDRERLADPRGNRTRLGEPVSDDMSSRTGSVNFFKKNIFWSSCA
jgi:hypothetical protein